MQLALFICLAAVLAVVRGFQHSFTRRSKTSLSSMSTTAERASPKANVLKGVKAKATGRDELDGLMMDDGDSTSYELFAEADGESTTPPRVGETITGTVIEMDDIPATVMVGATATRRGAEIMAQVSRPPLKPDRVARREASNENRFFERIPEAMPEHQVNTHATPALRTTDINADGN